MNLTEQLLDQSTAIRTKVLPEVLNRIGLVSPSFDTVAHYKTNIKEWLAPVVDLTGFHVYPTNGITEGLNWWSGQETRGIHVGKGDYQWIIPTGDDLTYISVPSSIQGNFVDYPRDRPVALDLAYVGSTRIQQIPIHENVERAFFSLSKSFGVRNIRTGWYFVREKDPRLEDLIYRAKYYNYYARDVAETIISSFAIDHVWNRLRHQQQIICDQLGLTASDSVWLAGSKDPIYSRYRRQDDIARICLAGVYDYGS